MDLFDTHCHLTDKAFAGDLADVFQNALAANVKGLMIVGTGPEDMLKARDLTAEAPEGLKCCFSGGLTPFEVQDAELDAVDALKDLFREYPGAAAWGEIGLDFNRMYSPREAQERWFVEQLATAGELNLPIIFHERDSDGRLLKILKEHPNKQRKGVIHCFSGNENELNQYLEMGFYIGITGILTLKQRGESLRKLAGRIPAESLVVETDAPYLTPAPEIINTRRNEPAFVKSVLLKLAKVRGEDPGFLASAVWENSCRLYNITETES